MSEIGTTFFLDFRNWRSHSDIGRVVNLEKFLAIRAYTEALVVAVGGNSAPPQAL
jgi:hypothetical protein